MTGRSPSAQLPPDAESPQWQLNREVLAAALDALLAAPALAELRGGVAELRQRLANPGDPLHHAGEYAVRFTPEVLHGELDQIAAARTLERARYYVARLRRALEAQRFAPASDIDLHRWKEYDDILTDSLWLIERRDNSGCIGPIIGAISCPKSPASSSGAIPAPASGCLIRLPDRARR